MLFKFLTAALITIMASPGLTQVPGATAIHRETAAAKERAEESPLRLRYRGKLMTLDEIAHARKQEHELKQNQALLRKVKPLFVRLTSRHERTRDRALDQLLTLAQAENKPAIAREARQLHATTEIRVARARLTIRAQTAGPTTFRRRAVSLGGNSTPVNLELPSRSITSLKTTVGFSFGL